MSGINLTGAMRSNLLSLNNTQSQINSTQNRLATGLKVSSAIDNPRNFFQAQSLSNRANDLTNRLDGMKIGVRTLQAADEAIKAMTKVVETMAAVVKDGQDALAAGDTAASGEAATEFDALRTQLNELADDATYNGINLLGGDDLEVLFSEDASGSSLSITAVDWSGTANPAGIEAAVNSWGLEANTDAAEDDVSAALDSLRSQAAEFGNNLSTVRIREDFTKGMVNTLQGGSDDLTLADENEEAANLLALQTRQQLGIQALSLASQSQQGILRLF